MTIAAGTDCYNVDDSPVQARGSSFTEAELNDALSGSISAILWDDKGTGELQTILAGIITSDFESENLKRVITGSKNVENWRVGEALTEAWLIDHRNCLFPWPVGRDLRNPSASPAGTDLVGFQKGSTGSDQHRFAFGEVKTSQEERWPPTVVYGRHGLQRQLEDLRDSDQIKDSLVKYLGHHANGTDWFSYYQNAAKRYLANSSDISLFGFLIRDVEAKKEDLTGRAHALANGCPATTSIELRAIYLPKGSISTLAERALSAWEGTNGQN